jgi:subtilisin-like proprotein convertase family protein
MRKPAISMLKNPRSWSLVLFVAVTVLMGPLQSANVLAFHDWLPGFFNNAASSSISDSVGIDTPNTTATSFTFSNPTTIIIPAGAPGQTSGPASPYPSSITVSGVPSTVDKVTVTINSFSHTFPGDVAVLLVAPSGQKMVLLGNVGGGTDAVNATLTFDDAAATAVPTAIVSGTYRPTAGNANPLFPNPAPPGPYPLPPTAGAATLASIFTGINPNGTWSLYVNDSAAIDVGQILGWSLTLTNAITAQNTAAITVPDSGTASLYPSSLNVSGLIGSVASVTVILNNFSHTAPDDVDLLLVAPGGRNIVLMSDVGGSTPVTNLGLTFDDNAPTFLPDAGPLVAGSFKPTNIDAGDLFPAPAPSTPPAGTTLSALNGVNPNGNWSLFLVDDNSGNAGSIAGGWSIAIATSATACSLNLTPPLQVFPVTGGAGSFDLNTPFGCDWTAASLSSFVTVTSPTSGSGGVATITFTVEPNMLAGRTGTIRVSNAGFTRDFMIQQPSGCPFALNQETQQFGSGGGLGSVQVTAAGVCGWSSNTKDPWITITSGTGTGNGTVSFTVAPNPSSSARVGTVSIGARTLTIIQGRVVSGARAFDFDGDGKTDLSVFRPASATWYISQSMNGSVRAEQFGISTDRLTPADYDGDGKVDIAVFRDGVWYWVQSSDNTFKAVQWGTAGDRPAVADYDGDDKADLAVYRPGSPSVWYVRRSSDNNMITRQFGISSDRPLPGDFDNDDKADFTLYRAGATAQADSFWYMLRSSDNGFIAHQFGRGEDLPAPGDYDGDGAANFALFRPSSGVWFTSLDPATNFGAVSWGTAGDVPVAGDYDGDGRIDVAVYRQGVWYIRQSFTGALRSEQWGVASDVAVPAAFLSN